MIILKEYTLAGLAITCIIIYKQKSVFDCEGHCSGARIISLTPLKGLTFGILFTYQAFKSLEKELFVEQILLSDLGLDTFELKNTKSDQSVSLRYEAFWFRIL